MSSRIIGALRSTRSALASRPAASARWRFDRELALPTTLPSWLVLLAAIGACIGWTLQAGPEWSLDRMHYHEYAGWQVFEGALGRGFMPAGGQTFLNPVAYLPAHLLARAGLGELGVALVLSVLHAGCVGAVWFVSRRALAPVGPDVDRYAATAAVLAFLTPVFLLEVGSSYIDATTTLSLLVGVACALRTLGGRGAGRWALAAGLAFGLAAGLKLSNAVPAVAGTVLVLWGAGLRGAPLRLFCYVAGGVLGTVIGHGWWSAQLWSEFGNPVFPMFAGLFGTPAAAVDLGVATAPLADSRGPLAALLDPLRMAGSRFTPRDLTDWLSFPVRIADPGLAPTYAYIESRQPDPRLLLIALLGVAAFGLKGWRRLNARALDAPGRLQAQRAPSAFAALAVFWFAWYVLWTATSSNARYAIGLLMLASPLMVGAVAALWRAPARRAAVLLVLVAVQAVWALLIADPRSSPTPVAWDRDTLRIQVPTALRETPALHVTRFSMSWSVLAPHVHPASSFANLNAMCEYCDPWRDAGAARRVLDAWGDRARLLDPALLVVDGHAQIAPAQRAGIDAWLGLFDRRIDTTACQEVVIAPNPTRIRMQVTLADGGWQQQNSDRLLSCPIVADPGAADRVGAMARRVDDVFEAFERQCARELGPQQPATRWLGGGTWTRTYPHSALTLFVSTDSVFAMSETGHSTPLGRLAAVRAPSSPIDCSPLAASHREIGRIADARRVAGRSAPLSFDGLVPAAAVAR